MQSPTETPSNLRTLLILEVLGKSDRPMTATEINVVLNLLPTDRASLMRHAGRVWVYHPS